MLILILQFDLICGYLSLTFDFILLIVDNFSSAFTVLNFGIIDASLSSIIFLLLIPILLIFRKKISSLNEQLTFTYAFLAILIFLFLFAPVITNEDPEFSKNLSVTKLLPPLHSVNQLTLKSKTEQNLTTVEKFKIKSDRIIKPSFNNRIIFADSVFVKEKVFYWQKNVQHEIDKKLLVTEGGISVINSKVFIIGTDEFGRDLFARLIYGTRISITIGLGAVALSFFIGMILGFLAGYRGGILDILLNRFTEMFLAFPVIYLIVLILALFGSSIFSVIIVLGISGWMSLFKIVKTEVISIKQKDYFKTANLVGLSKYQLLKKEILPIVITPVMINLIFLFSNVILAEAALSYLGLGGGNSYPSWGSMISSGQEYISKAWWLIAFPGLALILTLFTFNASGKKFGRKLNPIIK